MAEDGVAAFLDQRARPAKPAPAGKGNKAKYFSIGLPRRVFMFWDTGFETAPEIVKLCVASWQHHNPGWDIVLLDQQAADQVIPRGKFPPEMRIAHYADMLRIALLRDGGGVWADASCLCLRPLDHWLPNIFNQSEFFAFHRPAPDRLISNWFLAASADSVIARDALALFDDFWDWGPHRDGDKPPYFWFHYLFEHLVQSERHIKLAWAQTPKLSAVPVHQLKRVLTDGIADSDRLRDRIRATPVQKLTQKQGIPADDVRAYLARIGITV